MNTENKNHHVLLKSDMYFKCDFTQKGQQQYPFRGILLKDICYDLKNHTN